MIWNTNLCYDKQLRTTASRLSVQSHLPKSYAVEKNRRATGTVTTVGWGGIGNEPCRAIAWHRWWVTGDQPSSAYFNSSRPNADLSSKRLLDLSCSRKPEAWRGTQWDTRENYSDTGSRVEGSHAARIRASIPPARTRHARTFKNTMTHRQSIHRLTQTNLFKIRVTDTWTICSSIRCKMRDPFHTSDSF